MARMKVTVKGLDSYEKMLNSLGANASGAMSMALYDGAKAMADEVRKRIQGLPAVPDFENLKAYGTGQKNRLSEKQKAGLLAGLGIANFEKATSEVNTVIGFNGYNDVKTNKYPEGQPNQMVARIYESGTSYSQKTPFMRPAKNSGKPKAEAKMKEAIENWVEKVKSETGNG